MGLILFVLYLVALAVLCKNCVYVISVSEFCERGNPQI